MAAGSDRLVLELVKKMGRAILDYGMISDGDRILVALSGGKDSLALIDLLHRNLSMKVFPIRYELVGYHVTLRKDAETPTLLEDWCRERGIDFRLKRSDLHPFIANTEKHRKNPCYICSQIRRKWIFDAADELGIQKIAFGHTLDDIVTTSLMNIFYNRHLASECPNLSILKDKFRLIRPLAYIEEKDIRIHARESRLPVFKAGCAIGDNKRRKYVQKLVDSLSDEIPNLKNNIYAAFRNPAPDFFLDREFAPIDHTGKKYRP